MTVLTCSTIDCDEVAVCIPKINVPAMGREIGQHTPLGMMLDLPFCALCAKQLTLVEQLMTLETQQGMAATILESGKTPPDFSRAWISRVSLKSSEYAQFKRVQLARSN